MTLPLGRPGLAIVQDWTVGLVDCWTPDPSTKKHVKHILQNTINKKNPLESWPGLLYF